MELEDMLDDMKKKVLGKNKSPDVLEAKVKYLEKLNSQLLTYLVKREYMTGADARMIIAKAKQDAR